MSTHDFGTTFNSIESIIERHALDLMAAQRFIDQETTLERDRYCLTFRKIQPELREFFRFMIPVRPMLFKTSFQINVSMSLKKSISGGLKARLLNGLEVAGFEIYRESKMKTGSRLTFELVQISHYPTNQERRKKP